MKVKDAMIGTPYYCRPESNLGTAVELMWKGNCGFLPVVDWNNQVSGILTDRDICIALGTRNRLASDVTAQEVASGKVYCCEPNDDIHVALHTMSEHRVRRLPVVTKDGALVGVLSLDDVAERSQPLSFGREPELSCEETVRTFRSIATRQAPQTKKKAVAA